MKPKFILLFGGLAVNILGVALHDFWILLASVALFGTYYAIKWHK